MHLLTLGLNHQTAPLALRERAAFLPDEVVGVIGKLRDRLADRRHGGVREAAIISTCNRTELVCAVETPEHARNSLAAFVAAEKQLDHGELARATYVLPQSEAVRHAFRVASGLDSMVLGEPQILGQIKEAVKLARDAGSMGLLLNQLFQRTFAVAKEVRTTTEIGAQSVSMAAAAVRVAERIYGALESRHVLFVGAGEMIELSATHFAARHPKSITVANRTLERAQRSPHGFTASRSSWRTCPSSWRASTSSCPARRARCRSSASAWSNAPSRARKHRPMFMVDLAVPRDIEAEVARLDDVFLYTVDDLGKIVRSGSESRQAAVAQAEAIIETRVRDFMHWWQARAAVPVIQGLRDRAPSELRALELERARRLLARGDAPEAVLEAAVAGADEQVPARAACRRCTRRACRTSERARLAALLERFYNAPDN